MFLSQVCQAMPFHPGRDEDHEYFTIGKGQNGFLIRALKIVEASSCYIIRLISYFSFSYSGYMVLVSTLYGLVSFLVSEWEALYKILRKLFSFFRREQKPGIYEILDYETTLELSATGKTAKFLKRQSVCFLQDNVISFEDYAWGEGEIFADYQCAPGIVVDRYLVGDRWNILISLRESKSRGDVEEFFIESTFKDAFLSPQEWQQVEIRHYTKHLKMTIIFPKSRLCRRAVIHQRRYHRSIELDYGQFGILPDGRQVVTWETNNIAPLEIYTLRWEW